MRHLSPTNRERFLPCAYINTGTTVRLQPDSNIATRAQLSESEPPPPRAQMYLAHFLYPLPYPECFLPSLKYVPRAKTKTKRLCLCPRLRL